MTTTPSTRMEQQVERIKRLIADEGSIVTWNERMPDPDNPKHRRQIDVTIRRDSLLTLVECRMRATPEDVTWIEECKRRLRDTALPA